jgi:hypothetical protein
VRKEKPEIRQKIRKTTAKTGIKKRLLETVKD